MVNKHFEIVGFPFQILNILNFHYEITPEEKKPELGRTKI